jgi:hypothetical protein
MQLLFYTVEGKALDGHSAAICDIGDFRIAVVKQDISKTGGFSEGLNLVVSGGDPKQQRLIATSQTEYFTSVYENGEAQCRFHGFNFKLTDQMIHFGTTGLFWDNPSSPGLLIMVEAETGKVITQAMKPKAERLFLAAKESQSTCS